jgi:2-polyprenyl-6-methoxyphenol hydroxylase-like FAD-dependent oxidoreductase
MTKRPKALIIGGGIAGPVTAIFMKQAGIDAELFEAWPHSTGIGGGLQIAPNGMHVLAEIGLADEMIRNGSIAEAFEFHSQNGTRLGSINHNMQQRFGQPAVNMCRATLNEALINKAWCDNVELRFEKRLVAIEDRADRPIVAHFADGSSAEGDFLIGADGVHSAVRGHVVPDGPKPFDTGLLGFGGFVPRSVIAGHPDRPARRDDVRAKRVLRLWLLQLRSQGRGDVVEHATVAWRRRCGIPQPEPGCDQAASARVHAGWHDPIPRILDAAEDIVVTATLDVATLPTWSRRRTLLIGDAAHATSPHAGQGASLALEDAMRLGRLMGQGQELSLTFQQFEDERRPRAEKIVALARRNGNNKREFSATGAWIRDRMLKLLIPITAKGMDWMYAYDPRAAEPSRRAAEPSRRAA